MALYRTSGANPTGDAVEANVLSGKIFSNDSGTDKVGTMPNNGAVSPSALSPNGSYTIPEGYHNGNGIVIASPNTGTYSPTTRNAALDMGISNLNRYVNTNGVPNSNSGTYTASSRNAALDMGATNSYRYVNTNGVPNSNSGTYTPSSNGTALDMGATNTYRYVNTSTVYNLGRFNPFSTFHTIQNAWWDNGGNHWSNWTNDWDGDVILLATIAASCDRMDNCDCGINKTGGTWTEYGSYDSGNIYGRILFKIVKLTKGSSIQLHSWVDPAYGSRSENHQLRVIIY